MARFTTQPPNGATSSSLSRSPVGVGTFSMALSGFLVVVLALTLQQTHRMNTEIERLHWQLSLAQFTHSKASREVVEQVNQAEVLARIEQALKIQADRTSAPGDSVTEVLADLKKQLEEFQAKKESAAVMEATPRVSDNNSSHTTCPAPEPADDATEAPDRTFVLTKALTGLLIIVVLFGSIYIFKNLDRLPSILPNPLGKRLEMYMQELPPSKVLAYRVDYWFSTNKNSKAIALMTVTLLLVCFGGLAIYSVSETPLYDAIWESLAGVGIDWTFSDEATSGEGYGAVAARVVATVVSLGGLLVTALMLGIVSEAISEKVDEMKKGVSEVLEHDHTLILGWSDKLIPVITQVCLANESVGGKPIVIMAKREKEDMEAEISRANVNLMGSRIICRSGNPLLRYDLAKVSVHLARSIIVLANHQSPDQSDATVLRIVLSLVAIHDQHKEIGGLKVTRDMSTDQFNSFEGHIVCEMCDVDNEPLVKLVGQDKVETVVAHDIIGRLMIQCARQPGLAGVWAVLMGYDGCEFYLQSWPELEGKTFGEILLSFPDAVPLGVKQAGTKELNLNPLDSYIYRREDELLVLAEDDDTYSPGPCADVGINNGEVPEWKCCTKPERILFCGWRRDMDDMIMVMDDFVSPGSELWLYNEVPISERHELLVNGGLDPDVHLKNLNLFYQDEKLKGDLVTRKKLENLDPASFSSILILADESATGNFIADADSRNLATLLLLRDIMVKSNEAQQLGSTDAVKPYSAYVTEEISPSMGFFQHVRKEASNTVIISEILDSRTRNLIQELNISEFVMSNELVSMVLAMVSESAEVNTILKELFTDAGNELYVYPTEKYMRPGETMSFYGLVLRARSKSEICIGYKTKDEIVLNPPRKLEAVLSTESIEAVVVLAES